MLSTSPRDVQSFLAAVESNETSAKELKDAVFLQPFLKQLPHVIRQRKQSNQERFKDPITELFQKLELQHDYWTPYCHFDPTRPYTRNLVATDDETYTLLLLCWNPHQSSPIHDHPCDGCWMRVLEGNIREERFRAFETTNEGGDTMHRTSNQLYSTGQVLYMEDSMGYHRVSNPSEHETAVTIHLYCPPIRQCKAWLDEQQVEPMMKQICHDTEYGRKA